MYAVTYIIVTKLRLIIMTLKTKLELENLVKLYLEVEYQLDELLEDVYSYMHK